MEPLKLYWRPTEPNPMKVIIILEELGLPYYGQYLDAQQVHQPPFQPYISPMGKIPALYDPNTDLTLWESGSIVTYLIDVYDTAHKISFADLPHKYAALCWQHLQETRQGAYFSQAAWWNMLHAGKNESAQARYAKELRTILAVLDAHLADKDWLAGDKCSYADLSFVAWNFSIPVFMERRPKEEWDTAKFKHFTAWQQRMEARESVKKARSIKAEKDVASPGGSAIVQS